MNTQPRRHSIIVTALLSLTAALCLVISFTSLAEPKALVLKPFKH